MITLVREIATDPRVLVAAVSGELVSASAPELRRRLGALTAQGPREVVLDLSGVTFSDLAGLGPVLEARSVLIETGGRLRLRGVPGSLFALLRWTGLLIHFPEIAAATEPSLSPVEGYQADVRGYRNEVQSLRENLRSRQNVERAKGMLMAVHGCDAAGAWGILHTTSRAHHVRVRDLSLALTEAFTGDRSSSSTHASLAAALVEVVTPQGSTRPSSILRVPRRSATLASGPAVLPARPRHPP